MPNIEREIAVTSTQSALLRFQEHPRATPAARACFTISKEFKIRPQMDADRLRRAVQAIVARHDVMRTRFFERDGRFVAGLEKDPANLMKIERAPDEPSALARAAELAQQPIGVRDPMFRATLIRCGTVSDIVVAKAHHLVVDGYSLGQIVEEIVMAYMGVPLAPVEMDADRYAREFDHVGRPGSFERRDAFLRRLFSEPLPPVPNIGRRAKGLAPNVDIVDCTMGENLLHVVPLADARAVRARAKAAGTTEAAMVIAAFAQTIGAQGGVDDVIVQVPCALRHDRRLANYVNFVASDVPVRARLSAFDTLEGLAVSIGKGVDEAMEFAPFMDANYFGALHDEVVARGSYTSLFVAGMQTVDRWMRGTITTEAQRPNASGELDLGMFKVTPLPDMRRESPCISEIDFRSFPLPDGLGLGLRFDTSGFDAAEAGDVLQEIADRLTA